MFLTDTRLNFEIQKSGMENITKKFRFKGYEYYFNSKTSNRGTGILIKSNLDCTILEQRGDPNGNFLLLKIQLNNKNFIIGSVYGPNTNDNINIYNDLDLNIAELNCEVVILGGDWNCTIDTSGVESNLDVVNMAGIPSKLRSEKLNQISKRLKLTDPDRFLYPNKTEFSYIPAIVANTNRSRLDFFLISESLLPWVGDCCIANSLSSTNFDHKPISLYLNKKIKCRQIKQVQNSSSENGETILLVEIATIECYLHHISPNDTLTEAYLGEKLVIIRNIVAGVSRINIINKILCETDNNALEAERRELIENNDLLFSQLPNLPLLEAASLTCRVEFFFEALCCATREAALKQQSEIYKLGICIEKAKNAEIMVLKQDYINNQNIIFEKELELGEYLERRLKIELSNYNKFEMLNCEKITPYFMNLVKSCKKESTLDGIVREDGNIFTNKSKQEEYI